MKGASETAGLKPFLRVPGAACGPSPWGTLAPAVLALLESSEMIFLTLELEVNLEKELRCLLGQHGVWCSFSPSNNSMESADLHSCWCSLVLWTSSFLFHA